MLERLELNNRDPRRRELYVRHLQVYALLELNVRLYQIKNNDSNVPDVDQAIRETSVFVAELVTRFEEASAPGHKSPDYSDTQISFLERATHALKALCDEETSITHLMESARIVVSAGSKPRFARPRLVVSNV